MRHLVGDAAGIMPVYLLASYTAVTLAETVTEPERMPVCAPSASSVRAALISDAS